MKRSTLRRLIQRPLRFHHQDLHDEIENLEAMLLAIHNRLVRIERRLTERPDA